MSLIKDPSGSFYLESDQFNVDYEENSIKFVGESGEGATYTAGEGITFWKYYFCRPRKNSYKYKHGRSYK